MKYPIVYFSGPKIADFYDEIKLDKSGNVFHATAEELPISGQTNIEGLFIDFNVGLRMEIPKGNWHVKISDYSSKIIFFDRDISEVILVSLEKFFVRWEIILYRDGKLVFYHLFNPSDQKIHFQFLATSIGDNVVNFPYMEAFRKYYNCKVTCTVPKYLNCLIENFYPNVKLVDGIDDDTYAIYYISPTLNPLMISEDFRSIPMEQLGREIFGLPQAEKVIYKPTNPRQIQEKYVCIAVQTSATFKTWLNPTGWYEVVDYLKSLGYRVLCIDKNSEESDHDLKSKMPSNAENFTGDIPLLDRVNLLAYADFFIGCSSGLAWLAWACDIPVILISGITAPWCEFQTPYRIYNRLTCHGCHNWTNINWGEYETCPKFGGTDRAYECSTKISSQQVIEAIDNLRRDKNLN